MNHRQNDRQVEEDRKENMKKAEDCNSIEDIRECIDAIDRNIITDLSARSTFVQRAAKFKRTLTEVKADERVRTMISARRCWAAENGVDADFIESLFRSIIGHFIGNEVEEWNRDRRCKNDIAVMTASVEDAGTILSLQKRAYIQEVELNDNNFNIPPMLQDIDGMRTDFTDNTILKAIAGNQIVGSVRAKQVGSTCHIGRLIVEPIYQNQGIGRRLLQSIEERFHEVMDYELFTGVKSIRNRGFYKNAGYEEENEFDSPDGTRLI